MATYYIDPTWSGATNGTETEPFNSWSQVTWAAGNSYLQKAGTIVTEQISPSATGTLTSPIIIGAYGTTSYIPRAILNGTNITRPISIGTSLAYITIQDFEVYGGTGNGIIASAVSSPRSANITIQRCWVHGTSTRVDDNDSTAITLFCDGLTVKQCNIWDVQEDAIWVNGTTPHLVEDCRIWNVGVRKDRFAGDCIQFANWTGTSIIRRCNLTNNNDKQCIVGADLNATLLVEDCICTGGVHSINGNGAHLIVKRCKIFSTPITEVSDSVFSTGVYNPTTSRATKVYHTTIDCNNSATNAIYVFGSGASTATLEVINCTLINNINVSASTGLIRFLATGSTATIINNILSSSNNDVKYITTGTATVIVKNNLFLKEYANFLTLNGSNYSTLVLAEAADSSNRNNNLLGNPLLKPFLYPTNNSPIQGMGLFVGYLVDLGKTQQSNPPSIGAYEYISERAAAPTRGVR